MAPGAFARRVRPPSKQEVDKWLAEVPLWRRNPNYAWSEDEDNGEHLKSGSVAPERKGREVDHDDGVPGGSEGDWELKPIGELCRNLKQPRRPEPAPQETSRRAPRPRPKPRPRQTQKRQRREIRDDKDEEDFAPQVIDLSNPEGASGLLSNLLASQRGAALPDNVSDLSARSNLNRFLGEVSSGAEYSFTLLLLAKGYGSGPPASNWRSAAQFFSTSTPLSKDQKKVLKTKIGTGFSKLDPEGHVVGACFLRTGRGGKGNIDFLPLCKGRESGLDLAEEVDPKELDGTMVSFLGGNAQAHVCVDFQGIARRLMRAGDPSCRRHLTHPKTRLLDLKLLSWLLEPGLVHEGAIASYALGDVCRHFLGQGGRVEGEGEGDGPFATVARELGMVDALATSLLREVGKLPSLAFNLGVEMNIAALLARMEASFPLAYNLEEVRRHGERIDGKLRSLEEEAHGVAGEPFNLRSWKELGAVLYDKLGAPQLASRTSRNQNPRSTDESRLAWLAKLNDPKVARIACIVLEFRRLSQVVSKYIDADWLRECELRRDAEGRRGGGTLLEVHCRWNQTSTATGRLSCSDPNLQAVTKYTQSLQAGGQGGGEKINIRDAFVAKQGTRLLALDYSQIEIRLLAHLSGCGKLCGILNAGGDLFANLARDWLCKKMNVQAPSREGSARDQAKRTVYSIIYGTSAMALGQQLGIPVAAAQTLKRSFLEHFPGVKSFISNVKESCRAKGFVQTILQRRRYLPEINSSQRQDREAAERKAVNTVVQGSAADLIKAAMVRWSRMRRATPEEWEVRLVAQIHDELLFEVPERIVDHQAKQLAAIMTGVFPNLKVPILVNVSSGSTWGSLQKIKIK